MSIKKYSSGLWVTVPYRKYETATDTITSLPKTIIGDGQNISAYTIKGNMTQASQPTPQNPVYPQETGDKTANLCNVTQANSIYYSNYNNYTVANNIVTTSGNALFGFIVKVDNNKQYSVGVIADKNIQLRIREYSSKPTDWTTNFVVQSVSMPTLANTRTTTSFTTDSQTNYVLVVLYADVSYAPCTISDIILNEGSTALPYEPFGYKIPISLSQNTYNIYITEPLRKSLDGSNVFDTIESNGTLTRRVDANGDALATPTTEQVTVPTLTTTGTAEQFNVLTTLAPSEVSLTYHGWHDHTDTKYTSG